MRGAPLRLADVLEKDWDAQLFGSKRGVATMLGWTLTYHTLRSKGSRSGFPDRVLVRDRVVFVELKREKTGPTAEQVRWLDGLARGGAETYLWKPSDLDEVGVVLAKRWSFAPYRCGEGIHEPAVPPSLTMPDHSPPWVPGSIWIPGLGRADETGVLYP